MATLSALPDSFHSNFKQLHRLYNYLYFSKIIIKLHYHWIINFPMKILIWSRKNYYLNRFLSIISHFKYIIIIDVLISLWFQRSFHYHCFSIWWHLFVAQIHFDHNKSKEKRFPPLPLRSSRTFLRGNKTESRSFVQLQLERKRRARLLYSTFKICLGLKMEGKDNRSKQ